jgi:hypothetical protein
MSLAAVVKLLSSPTFHCVKSTLRLYGERQNPTNGIMPFKLLNIILWMLFLVGVT